MLILPQAAYSATQILEAARAQGVKGTVIKKFRNGQTLCEYPCEWVCADGSVFQSPSRIRAIASQQVI